MDLLPEKKQGYTLNRHMSITQKQIAEECRVSLDAVNKITRQHFELDISLSKQKV